MITNPKTEARIFTGAGSPASRQLNWYETFAFASRFAAQHGIQLDHRALPIAGTLQWCGLPDDDARKLLALVLGGVREALTNDTYQQTITQAGEDVWEGEDWSTVARQVRRRREIDEMRKAG